MAEIDDDIRQVIRLEVWSGFFGPEDFEGLIEDLRLDEPELDAAALRGAIAAEQARKDAAETTWPAITDCDRLDAAFAALPGHRVLALHDAGATMADGHSDAAEALDEAPPGRYLGYCFYHSQDIGTVLAGGELWIAFDHVDGDVPEKARIAPIVVEALKAGGLPAEWDGDTKRRIAIPGFDWKRRYAG